MLGADFMVPLLAIVAGFIALSFVCWGLILGRHYQKVGLMPLAIAYLCSLLGLFTIAFWAAYTGFDARLSLTRVTVVEAQRWSLVPARTVDNLIFSLIYAVPPLTLLGAPVAAWLIKTNRLNYRTIAISTVAAWMTLAVPFWLLWCWKYRAFDLFLGKVTGHFFSVVLIAGPFLLALYLTSHRKLGASE